MYIRILLLILLYPEFVVLSDSTIKSKSFTRRKKKKEYFLRFDLYFYNYYNLITNFITIRLVMMIFHIQDGACNWDHFVYCIMILVKMLQVKVKWVPNDGGVASYAR